MDNPPVVDSFIKQWIVNTLGLLADRKEVIENA